MNHTDNTFFELQKTLPSSLLGDQCPTAKKRSIDLDQWNPHQQWL